MKHSNMSTDRYATRIRHHTNLPSNDLDLSANPMSRHRFTNPHQSIARHATIAKEYLPFPSSYTITLPTPPPTPTPASHIITTHLTSLDLSRWTWDAAHSSGVGETSQNVWKRAYRREYEKTTKQGTVGVQGEKQLIVALAFRISVSEDKVVVEWVRGRDQVLWESFCGVVHRWVRGK